MKKYLLLTSCSLLIILLAGCTNKDINKNEEIIKVSSGSTVTAKEIRKQEYEITTYLDTGEQGSLRHALAAARKYVGHTDIYFNAALQGLRFDLNDRLDVMGQNITIDGGELGITISRNHNWDEANIILEGNNYTCALKQPEDKTVMIIVNSQDITVSGLTFDTTIGGVIPGNFSGGDIEGAKVIDTECFGDAITVFSKNELSYDNITIKNNYFSYCPDGCIDVVRPSDQQVSHVFIQGNTFSDTNKTMILGRQDNLPELLYVELTANRFLNNTQRQPRVQNADVCMIGNYIENWGSYAVGLFSGARVSLIENEFIPGERESGGLSILDSEYTGVYAEGNIGIGDSLDDTKEIPDICKN